METFDWYIFMYYLAIAFGAIAGIFFIFSFLSGLKIVKMKYIWHKRIGIIGFSLMCMHLILFAYFLIF